MYGIKERDVIRVKVKYCDNEKDPQIKKFAIDPRLTNYEVLNGLLVKGLNIKRDFVVHYLARDDFGEQFYLPLLSDWDLDAAILTASDPILRLKVNIKNKDKDLEEWDIVVPGEAPFKLSKNNINSKSLSNLFKSLNPSSNNVDSNGTNQQIKSTSSNFFSNVYQQMEKTVNSFQRVFSSNKLNDTIRPMKTPMSDIEFRNYMDNIGRIVQPDEFRRSVYMGGLEPSLRKVGWRLLLNVYPEGLNGRERLNLLEKKGKHYRQLKHNWKQRFKMSKLTEQEMAQIALVSVDVIRTDRSLNFYAAEKNFKHVCQLFDILTTYCIYHPSVGYYQGMSDLASPLLFVQQGDEAVAYLCFCSLMSRLSHNFTAASSSSTSTTTNKVSEHKNLLSKLHQLRNLINYLDPELSQFLHKHRMSDCHYAHRWLLLEMKREFPFCDSLRLLEIQWASLIWNKQQQQKNKDFVTIDGVPLVEENLLNKQNGSDVNTNSSTVRPSRVRCYAIRDMSLVLSLMGSQYTPSTNTGSTSSGGVQPTSPVASIFSDLESVFHESPPTNDNSILMNHSKPAFQIGSDSSSKPNTLSRRSSFSEDEDDDEDDDLEVNNNQKRNRQSFHEEFKNGYLPLQNSLNSPTKKLRNGDSMNDDEESNNNGTESKADELPGPDELGHGNPLLMFLCVSMLQEYRDVIMRGVTETADMLMLYQKLSQRHNMLSILTRAQSMFDQYLREQEIKRRNLNDFPELHLSM